MRFPQFLLQLWEESFNSCLDQRKYYQYLPFPVFFHGFSLSWLPAQSPAFCCLELVLVFPLAFSLEMCIQLGLSATSSWALSRCQRYTILGFVVITLLVQLACKGAGSILMFLGMFIFESSIGLNWVASLFLSFPVVAFVGLFFSSECEVFHAK